MKYPTQFLSQKADVMGTLLVVILLSVVFTLAQSNGENNQIVVKSNNQTLIFGRKNLLGKLFRNNPKYKFDKKQIFVPPPKVIISAINETLPISIGNVSTIYYPGSIGTFASGINNTSDIVGSYISKSSTNGFKVNLLNQYTSHSFGSNFSTDIFKINDSGVMVGRAVDEFGEVCHGFRIDSGIFTPIDFPGSNCTEVSSINNLGTMVGTYLGDIDEGTFLYTHGFKMQNGSYTTIDYPGAENTYIHDINDNGDIVGSYQLKDGIFHSFKLSGGLYTTIGVPDSDAGGINNHGDIVGVYGSLGNQRGFKISGPGNTFNSIVLPGAIENGAFDINDLGEIVGGFCNPCSDDGLFQQGYKLTQDLPVIDSVERTYYGFFLDGSNLDNIFDIGVNWRGMPGRVRFQVNDNSPFEVAGNSIGVRQAFNLDTSFPASYTPSTIKIKPINGEGIVGLPRTEEIYVFPYPTWLQIAIGTTSSALNFSTQAGEVRANFDILYPREPFRALIPLPTSVPFIGGQFGIRETQGRFNGFASSTGGGNLTLSGSTGFVGMEQQINGTLSGNGNFLLNQNGLSIPSASFDLGLSGTVRREVRLIDAIPFLSRFNRFPAVRRFTGLAKLSGELKPSFGIGLNWKQDPITSDLIFNEGTGQIGVSLKGVLSSKISDRITFEVWLAGGGSMMVGVPSPFVRSLDLNFEPGAKLKIDNLFGGTELEATYPIHCFWIPATSQGDCSISDSLLNPLKTGNSFNPKLKLIQTPYKQFGKYESFKPEEDKQFRNDITPSTIPAVEETIISNVFSGAEPTILPVGNNGKILLWVRQNPNLPVLQSTEIAWSYNDGTNWSAPAVIVTDTRAEFSPVAGVDSNGNVVAAWLKIKDPAFNTPIPTFDDLPLFYKQVEVVSAVFNPTTRTWSAETSLTNDVALDTSLRLAKDNKGNLLLTWQSNPSGEFTADNTNPATLKYSFWNGSNWNAPSTVANNLSNISEHAVAMKGNNAFIVLPYDPDINSNNDSQLLVYNWNGINWSQGTVFAGNNVDDQLPTAVYDTTDRGQIIWLKGADLVQANLSNSIPQIVRQGSESAAFYNIRLLNNEQDNLTLIWQEIVDNGPANIFAKIFDPTTNSWGDDRRLNQSNLQSKDANGYYDNGGKLHLVYLATQILRVTRTVTINGQNYEIPDVPENGQTDIQLLSISQSNPNFDFDGDGRSDISVYRPSTGVWYLQQSLNGFTAIQFGIASDRIASADFDGDGKTDIAVYRDGVWYLLRSASGFTALQFGIAEDIPQPADFDGDGRAEIAVYRPSTGVWYSLNLANNQFTALQFGISEDKPVVGDYDGDGKTDIAVYRPSTGVWYILQSTQGFTASQFGIQEDKPVPADYDGDGKTDLAVYRPSSGVWYFLRSTQGFTAIQFGIQTDKPTPADFDGDGKTDLAVYRPSNGVWYLLNSSDNSFTGIQFGIAEDKPIPNAFVP